MRKERRLWQWIGQCFSGKNWEILRQCWDRRGNCACESLRERMVGRGWERFASMNFGMKDRLVCVVCVSVCVCLRAREWVNAKERKPGCVEISMGRWEVVVFRAQYVCMCMCLCKWLSLCVHITVVTSCWVVIWDCTQFFLKCRP